MPKQQRRLLRTATLRYAVVGAAFGLTFPVFATAISIMLAQLPPSLASVIAVQRSQPLLWIIDTAPVFLGLFASFVGRREDALQKTNAALRDLSVQLTNSQEETARKLEERSAQLQASADISRAAVSILDPQQLLSEVVNRIVGRFGFTYAAIFLLDHTGTYLILREATGEAGRILKERRHRLRVGLDSTAGYAVVKREPHIALIAGEDAVRFANPLLPDAQSEAALPLIVGDQALGALNVQSTRQNAFDDATIAALQNVAAQIAVALQNAESYKQLQQALDHATRQYELSRTIFTASTPTEAYESLGQVFAMLGDIDRISLLRVSDWDAAGLPVEYELATEWDVLGGAQFDTGRRYSAAEAPLARLVTEDEVIVIRDAGDNRLPLDTREQLAKASAQAVMLVPLIIRGGYEGFIAAVAEQPRDFPDSEVRLVRSAAEQLSMVLNNLQLTADMQTTLERVALLNRRLSGESWSHYLPSRGQWLVESGYAPQAATNTGLQIPIVVRGQTIGVFNVADTRPDRQWQEDELTMLQTIAGEVALTIENARLIEQTQRTAQRESRINEINTRVRQSVDLEAILRTAVTELGQSLKAARVVARVGTLTTDDTLIAASKGRGGTND